jgi:hypothetical protein
MAAMIRLILMIAICHLVYSFAPPANAYSPKEKEIAHAAGEYYGAIMLAKEFKGTQCGNVNIHSRWIDLERAKKEIFSKIPKKFHKELESEWPELENMAGRDVRLLIVDMNSAQAIKAGCEKVRSVFWSVFDKAVKRWQSY